MEIKFRLIVISDRLACAPTTLPDFAEHLAACGVQAFMIRERDSTAFEYSTIVNSILARTAASSMQIILHGHSELAIDRCTHLHVPESAVATISSARKKLRNDLFIGASVHDIEHARIAENEGASYVMFGPVFDTPSKRQYGPPQGLTRLQEITRSVSLPVFAVGGIKPMGVHECLAAGAFGVACISAVLPSAQTRSTVELFSNVLMGK